MSSPKISEHKGLPSKTVSQQAIATSTETGAVQSSDALSLSGLELETKETKDLKEEKDEISLAPEQHEPSVPSAVLQPIIESGNTFRFTDLPAGIDAKVLSFLTQREAARTKTVSKFFLNLNGNKSLQLQIYCQNYYPNSILNFITEAGDVRKAIVKFINIRLTKTRIEEKTHSSKRMASLFWGYEDEVTYEKLPEYLLFVQNHLGNVLSNPAQKLALVKQHFWSYAQDEYLENLEMLVNSIQTPENIALLQNFRASLLPTGECLQEEEYVRFAKLVSHCALIQEMLADHIAIDVVAGAQSLENKDAPTALTYIVDTIPSIGYYLTGRPLVVFANWHPCLFMFYHQPRLRPFLQSLTAKQMVVVCRFNSSIDKQDFVKELLLLPHSRMILTSKDLVEIAHGIHDTPYAETSALILSLPQFLSILDRPDLIILVAACWRKIWTLLKTNPVRQRIIDERIGLELYQKHNEFSALIIQIPELYQALNDTKRMEILIDALIFLKIYSNLKSANYGMLLVQIENFFQQETNLQWLGSHASSSELKEIQRRCNQIPFSDPLLNKKIQSLGVREPEYYNSASPYSRSILDSYRLSLSNFKVTEEVPDVSIYNKVDKILWFIGILSYFVLLAASESRTEGIDISFFSHVLIPNAFALNFELAALITIFVCLIGISIAGYLKSRALENRRFIYTPIESQLESRPYERAFEHKLAEVPAKLNQNEVNLTTPSVPSTTSDVPAAEATSSVLDPATLQG